jgi:hypothetical protein
MSLSPKPLQKLSAGAFFFLSGQKNAKTGFSRTATFLHFVQELRNEEKEAEN